MSVAFDLYSFLFTCEAARRGGARTQKQCDMKRNVCAILKKKKQKAINIDLPSHHIRIVVFTYIYFNCVEV